jgi:hypothetical protein
MCFKLGAITLDARVVVYVGKVYGRYVTVRYEEASRGES